MSWSTHASLLVLNTVLSCTAGALLLSHLGWTHTLTCGAVLWLNGLLIHMAFALWRADYEAAQNRKI